MRAIYQFSVKPVTLQSVALDKVEHRANMATGACRICIFGRTPGQPEGTQFDFVIAQLTQFLVK